MRKASLLLVLIMTVITVKANTNIYDVNKDGVVNVSDVTFLVNNILGIPNEGEDEQNFIYDVNGDDVVNVADVTSLVNNILGEPDPDEDYFTCPDGNHPHRVDLGLPSGTLWSCCNVGAENPISSGNYYAWGETVAKDVYDEDNYTYCFEVEEPRDIAATTYDVAYKVWGNTWCMPSEAQMKELIENCPSEETILNDVTGRLFRASNGNTIFLPAAGFKMDDTDYHVGIMGYYWTSTLSQDASPIAYELYFGNVSCYTKTEELYYGLNVRPVSYTNLP